MNVFSLRRRLKLFSGAKITCTIGVTNNTPIESPTHQVIQLNVNLETGMKSFANNTNDPTVAATIQPTKTTIAQNFKMNRGSSQRWLPRRKRRYSQAPNQACAVEPTPIASPVSTGTNDKSKKPPEVRYRLAAVAPISTAGIATRAGVNKNADSAIPAAGHTADAKSGGIDSAAPSLAAAK